MSIYRHTAIPEADVPYPRHGRLWDDTLTGIQRLRRVDFLLGLGLDPSRVPDGARIEYDPTTDEYRVQYIGRAGHLVWVRRRWSLRQPGPRKFGAITEDLADLREAYAYPYDSRHLPAPHYGRIGGETEPAVFDRSRYEAAMAEFRARLAKVAPAAVPPPVTNPVITYDPARVADTLEARAHRFGLPTDLVIHADPVVPDAFLAAQHRVDYMRGRGA